jgi:hypothetical protein
MKLKLSLVLIGLIAVFIAGCELTEPKPEKPDYLVSINEIIKYPRASQIEKEIPTITGTTKWISTAPYLFSNAIEKIEAIPNESDKNFFDLKMKLNYRGKLMWTQLFAEMLYKDMGFIINDILYRRLTQNTVVQEVGKDDVVILKLKLDSITANAIANASEKNYRYFNPDAEKEKSF